jgi:Rrf2 family iron-sulfur cluster assembly transcriptional regulator
MKLSSSVSYAVGILLQVYTRGADGPMTAAAIADGCKFPPRFLYRILRRLVDAGLLTGVSGPGGGYTLAKPSRSISLLDVVSAVDGPPEASKLTPVCSRHRQAINLINDVSVDMARRASKELKKVTLDKLGRAAMGKRGQPRPKASKVPSGRQKTTKAARATVV